MEIEMYGLLIYTSGRQTLRPEEPNSSKMFLEFHVKCQIFKPRAKMREISMKYMNW